MKKVIRQAINNYLKGNIRISEKKKHQFYVDYPYFQGAKPPFIFSGFIWNQKNEQVIYKNVNALLYQLK